MTFLHKLSNRLALMKASTATSVTGVPTPATKQPIAHTATQPVVSPKTVALQQSEAPNFTVVRASGGLLHLMMERTP